MTNTHTTTRATLLQGHNDDLHDLHTDAIDTFSRALMVEGADTKPLLEAILHVGQRIGANLGELVQTHVVGSTGGAVWQAWSPGGMVLHFFYDGDPTAPITATQDGRPVLRSWHEGPATGDAVYYERWTTTGNRTAHGWADPSTRRIVQAG